VSEYQYYDFRALDRALTKAEMAELRSVSTRAQLPGSSLGLVAVFFLRNSLNTTGSCLDACRRESCPKVSALFRHLHCCALKTGKTGS
jgi:hypothetical protein